MSLLFKECRQISKSIIYLVFIGVIVLFYVTQIGDSIGSDIREARQPSVYNYDNPLMKPPARAKDYGSREAEIPEQVMPGAIASLVQEYTSNQYAAYPFGFYKSVKLSEDDQAKLANIITEITGKHPDALLPAVQNKMGEQQAAVLSGKETAATETNIPIKIAYEAFRSKMAEIDDILGGGSKYAPKSLKSFGKAAITFEEKLAEYNAFINEDQISGAYARLFCDYMGITLSLFSIFVPVAYVTRDRKARMNELIYSRRFGSIRLIVTRYVALVLMLLLPFILLSFLPLIQLVRYGMDSHLTVDLFAFIKYIAAWLLPTLMTTTAVGLFLTTLTDTPIAIAVQFLWSYLDINNGISRIYGGDYGLGLTIRHNSLFHLQTMKDDIGELVVNRLFYVALSLVLVLAAILIYEMKRRGKLDLYGRLHKIFRHRQNAAQADAFS